MLEFRNVSLSKGGNRILSDINTQFKAGQITAILGPNGSGKSSLIKLLNEKESSYEGDIFYQNQKYERFTFVSSISILLQQVTTPDYISVFFFIKYVLISNFGLFS